VRTPGSEGRRARVPGERRAVKGEVVFSTA
jgi:hypothetical protein